MRDATYGSWGWNMIKTNQTLFWKNKIRWENIFRKKDFPKKIRSRKISKSQQNRKIENNDFLKQNRFFKKSEFNFSEIHFFEFSKKLFSSEKKSQHFFVFFVFVLSYLMVNPCKWHRATPSVPPVGVASATAIFEKSEKSGLSTL